MYIRFFLALLLAALAVNAQQEQPNQPRYTADGHLIRPENYREWIYLSSGLGMTYGIVDKAVNGVLGQHFDNVFVSPDAYRSFQLTGRWPDKTVFVMEVRTSASKGSINKGGRYQEGLFAIEAHVKDESRYETGWEFFGFRGAASTAKPLGAPSSCQTCHSTNGAVDSTFVQFYPTLLPIAEAKGTLRQGH